MMETRPSASLVVPEPDFSAASVEAASHASSKVPANKRRIKRALRSRPPLAADGTAIPGLNQASAYPLSSHAGRGSKTEARQVCLCGHMPDVSVRIGRLNGTLDDGYPKIHGVGVWDRLYAW